MSNWISVNDRLPDKEDMLCWIAVKGAKEPDIDTWENDRGKPGRWHDGEEFIHSGWYSNCSATVTHWMPVAVPEMPKEDA